MLLNMHTNIQFVCFLMQTAYFLKIENIILNFTENAKFYFQWNIWDKLFKGYKSSGHHWPLCISWEGILFTTWTFFFIFITYILFLFACQQKGRLCSDSVIGEGNTIAWKMCGLDNQTSLCIFFDIATIGDFNEIVRSESNQFYFQFLT